MYCFPIHFSLPQDLPSSFKSSIASVHYYLKIKSKSLYKLKKNVTFNVVSNVNLNNFDDMMASIPTYFINYSGVGGRLLLLIDLIFFSEAM